METQKPKIRFYTERDSFGVEAGVILMALSVIFRLIGTWGLWNDRNFMIAQIALPVGAALLFILFILLLGRIALWTTSLPVILGVMFFIIKALDFDSKLHMILCILLYVLVAVLWCGTVFNLIRTKWLLPPLFLLPFLYHIVMEDLPAMQNTAQPVTFAAGMQEMSVLSIMLALFFTSLAMKKRIKEPKGGAQTPSAETGEAAAESAEPAAAAAVEAPAAETPGNEAPAAPAPQPESPEQPTESEEAPMFEEHHAQLTLDPTEKDSDPQA